VSDADLLQVMAISSCSKPQKNTTEALGESSTVILPSTPAAEVRVIPASHFYIKSMVFAADRAPYAHNPTGFVPQFHGDPMSVSEIGFIAPGRG